MCQSGDYGCRGHRGDLGALALVCYAPSSAGSGVSSSLYPEVSRLRVILLLLSPQGQQSQGRPSPCTLRLAGSGASSSLHPEVSRLRDTFSSSRDENIFMGTDTDERGRGKRLRQGQELSIILSFAKMAGGTLSARFLGLAICEQIRCEKCETRGTGYILSLAVAWPVASP